MDSHIDYSSGPLKGVHRDVPADEKRWTQVISMGAGSFLVCDQNVSPVAFLRELLHFFAAESCGKCTPCRVGTWRSLQILDRMAAGEGSKGDTDELEIPGQPDAGLIFLRAGTVSRHPNELSHPNSIPSQRAADFSLATRARRRVIQL